MPETTNDKYELYDEFEFDSEEPVSMPMKWVFNETTGEWERKKI